MAEVRWTPQALDDLEAICLFIARDAPSVAAVFAQRAFDATDRLVDFPESAELCLKPIIQICEKSFWATIESFTESALATLRFLPSTMVARESNARELESGA